MRLGAFPPGATFPLGAAFLLGAALLAGLGGSAPPAAFGAHASGTLSVERPGGSRVWWRADQAPARWSAPDTNLTGALAWKIVAPGLEWATLRLECPAPAWRSKLIIARIDPREIDLSLELDLTRDRRPAWTIDRAPREALLAVNAGQFVGGMPWGWVVRDGRQLLRPGYGPLASAISIDASGRIRWAHADSILSPDGVALGLQSYPTLLSNGGAVALPLQRAGEGVSHEHRDSRLAIGETRDGRLLVVLTRFDAMGEITGALPLGPTTPEMAAILGALGSRDAVMLDGGISAQLLIREPGRKASLRWPGMRKVPLALIARARARLPR